MATLDWDYYPHIRDLVLDAAPDETISALRLTQRAARDYLDRRLAQHILYVVKRGRLYTRAGHVELNFQSQELAPRINVLDVYTSDLFDPHDAVALDLPNLEYARLPCIGDMYDILPAIAPAPRCVIQAVLPRDPVDSVVLNSWTSPQTQKMIFALPRRLTALRCRNVRYSPALADVRIPELVIVLLPGLDGVWDDGFDDTFGTEGETQNRFKPDYLQGIVMESLRSPGVTLTLVGLEGLDKKIAGDTTLGEFLRRRFLLLAESPFRRAAWPQNPDGRRLRIISLDEWRAQVPAHEWQLVASLPECVTDKCAK